ncbi:site-2 protease family protein [Tissierella carlieri]|jgi:Zn-dependent protease|uniref:Site-2 protease family protein n=1 Tax=Tissierella carlieri TaxID=689904 RepID=A0ABT1S5P0_9FIRM|nr:MULTISPECIES: site-2 protease family protein [Tissierella]MBU5311074.1 site-2 protease family protein [Tissierella carlieri]MCQ4921667.1 site-2 protease family protein [Tissierella carlieri]MDU5079999.1 site-2 protease family protein [Bacillota bacterium]OZV12797.1 site-2 protease family protein [Tissierella sp. P1]
MDIIYNLPGLFTAIIFHELAHGFTAYLLGDNTAKDSGRLTLNPFKHMDLTGFLFLLIFKFGWAKPVPINPFNFKNRKRDTILVSLAGPLSNFIIAIIIGFLLSLNIITNSILFKILFITLWYNIMLGVFNLLPFPPLDGSKIIASLLPKKLEYYFYKYEKYLYVILIILIATNTVDRIMGPIIDAALNILILIIG